MAKEKSLTVVVATVFLAGVLGSGLLLSFLFLVQFRTVAYHDTNRYVDESINHLKDKIAAELDKQSGLLEHSAIVAMPYMCAETLDAAALQDELAAMEHSLKNVMMIYCTSNVVWNGPDGFAVFSRGWVPPPDWNNTIRPWFIDAKAARGKPAFTAPYVDAVTGEIVITISQTMFDTDGKDLGVIAEDVAITSLGEMVNAQMVRARKELDGLQSWLIHSSGKYITNQDIGKVMEADFFEDMGFSQFKSAILFSPLHSGVPFFGTDGKFLIHSQYIPAANWYLVSTVPVSTVYTGVNNITIRSVLLAFVFILIFGVIIGSVMRSRYKAVRAERQKEQHLQATRLERDEIAAMKDNLKTGVFFMNRDCIIQPNYSRAMEQVLAERDLTGKSFTELLSASVGANNARIIKDYFAMVVQRRLDQAMLDDINPLREFGYTHIHTGEERTLRCAFAPVERDKGEVFILGTIDDISEETRLRRKLEEEERKRQEEMRSLFEVIHIEPQVFSDFTADVDYNFDRISEILNDPNIPRHNALSEIYQLVHAAKSDSVIIGLENFGEKLHGLESEIKRLQDKEESEGISEEDMRLFTAAFEQILKAKFVLVSTLERVHSSKPEGGGQESHVLIEAIKKTCSKVALDTGKKVQFEARNVEAEALKNAPRRQIKEILMQLARNAVYHGLESPAERKLRGKDETGMVMLSMSVKEGKLHITLSDNGGGIDFEKLKEKAVQMKLVKAEADVNDAKVKNKLLQVMFMAGVSTAEAAGMHAGRGIGLNLVLDRIRELHGTIRVRSEKEHGTAFDIVIPAAA
jgi:signal transduction histidine kinase